MLHPNNNTYTIRTHEGMAKHDREKKIVLVLLSIIEHVPEKFKNVPKPLSKKQKAKRKNLKHLFPN